MGGSGSGRIFVSSPTGDGLRCVFDFSEWTSTGMGACQDNAGKEYDLLIGPPPTKGEDTSDGLPRGDFVQR